MFPLPLREVLSFKEATGLVAASCVPRALKDISKTREGKGQAEAQVGVIRTPCELAASLREKGSR